MQPLSGAASAAVAEIARRHGFSVEATQTMLDALVRGGGQMAQFDHPEFSGRGQWMRGGMTMVSDMFNNDLKGWVDALCNDLSSLLAERPELFRPSAVPRSPVPVASAQAGVPAASGARPWGDTGWPPELGTPDSSGSQNGVRYAIFGATGRLAIERDGVTTLYDTLDHRIGGISQQQGGGSVLRFTSQHGPIDLASLPVVSGRGEGGPVRTASAAAATPHRPREREPAGGAGRAATLPATHHTEIAATLETLAGLKAKGILSAEEFDAKKAELLARI